jgi:hypothetical protein
VRLFLKQTFITADVQVELDEIKKLLTFNGFENNRRNAYVHKELGLIPEDMPVENRLVDSETLFFIELCIV